MRPYERTRKARHQFVEMNGVDPWGDTVRVPYPGAMEQLRRTGWVNAALDATALCTGLGAILLLYVVIA